MISTGTMAGLRWNWSWLAVLIVLSSGAALGHSGVTGPTKDRMALMKEIAASTKAIGKIAKSEGFSASEVEPHVRQISEDAERIGTVFTDPHMDPKSEALPVLWEQWDRFNRLAEDMKTAADQVAIAGERDEFLTAFDKLAEICRACHKSYRKPKE